MISKVFTVMALSLALPVIAFSQQINDADLKQYEWKNRLLLVFARSVDSDRCFQQAEIFKREEIGLKERDLKIFYLTDDGSATLDKNQNIPKAEVQRLADKYDVNSDIFTVILIGKDGTEKLRKNEPLKTEKLFSVIDAMPMRQREMRDNR